MGRKRRDESVMRGATAQGEYKHTQSYMQSIQRGIVINVEKFTRSLLAQLCKDRSHSLLTNSSKMFY